MNVKGAPWKAAWTRALKTHYPLSGKKRVFKGRMHGRGKGKRCALGSIVFKQTWFWKNRTTFREKNVKREGFYEQGTVGIWQLAIGNLEKNSRFRV